MLLVRKGGPSSGYVVSGFFGGLTLGRVLLLWVNRKVNIQLIFVVAGHRLITFVLQVGEVTAVYLYTILAILYVSSILCVCLCSDIRAPTCPGSSSSCG